VKIPVSPIAILEPAGYYSGDSAVKRHRALASAMKIAEYKDIIFRLNAVAIRLKNTQPKLVKNIRSDVKWMQKTYRSG